MADKTTTPTPATKPGEEADDSAIPNEELDKVSGGINPQPLPPRTGGAPPIVVD